MAVEVLFPTPLLLKCLADFGAESQHTRIELVETVLGESPQALRSGKIDLAIAPRIPQDLSGEALMSVRFLPVAHCEHPLHAVGREITLRDLRKHRHLVVRDTAAGRARTSAAVEVAQRWTVTNMTTSIEAVCAGYGFAWLPES